MVLTIFTGFLYGNLFHLAAVFGERLLLPLQKLQRDQANLEEDRINKWRHACERMGTTLSSIIDVNAEESYWIGLKKGDDGKTRMLDGSFNTYSGSVTANLPPSLPPYPSPMCKSRKNLL